MNKMQRTMISATAFVCLCFALALTPCDRANATEPQRLGAPVISNAVHGTTVGGEFSASISVPEGAVWVYAEFGRVDENGNIYGWPWKEIYPGSDNTFNVLGFDMFEPGTYRLEAQARINDGWEESEQDSELAVYEFTLADAEIPEIGEVTFSATENLQYNDTITYTVAGADAVTCQMDGDDWGMNPPTYYEAGNSDSILLDMPGNTNITIWARYNGVWSTPYKTTVYAQPLGILDMPELSWNGDPVGDSLTLPLGAPVTLSVSVENADYIYYSISQKTGPGEYDYEELNCDWTEDYYGEITISADQLTEGEYLLYAVGMRDGWFHTAKEVQLYLQGEAPQRLAAPVISDVVHGTTVGGEFSASISVPEGAAWVYAEFGRVDENGDFVSWPWPCDEIYSNSSNRFNVLGFDMLEPGTYRLQAQAKINEGWNPSDQDSEWAVYDFTLADAEIPEIDEVTLSATETVQFGETLTFTVAGADAVTCQISSEDGSWGTNPPTTYTEGSSGTITFWEPGGTDIWIWARYNGVWCSESYGTTIYVQPLGELDMPELSWNGNLIDDSLTLPAGTPLQFSAYVENADYIWYDICKKTGQYEYDWLGSESLRGSLVEFTINAELLTAGDYRLRVCGSREGWLTNIREVQLHLEEDLAFAVSDGRIIGYTGDETVTELVIPNAVTGQQITAIDEFVFCSCDELTRVTLPAGIQILDSGAFMGCPLTSVLVPAGTDTKDWYFYEPARGFGLPRVYCVALPASVTKAEAPFLNTCMPSMTPDFVTPVGLETIESEAFANTDAGFVWLTDGVTAIGDGAFAGCGSLRFVRIPDSCQSIGANAFPSDVILFVEWNSEAMDYAIQNGYTYECYAEGFNG